MDLCISYVCMYGCTYVSVRMVFSKAHMDVHILGCMHVCMYVSMFGGTYGFVHIICMYVCMYVCISAHGLLKGTYGCVHILECMHICIQAHGLLEARHRVWMCAYLGGVEDPKIENRMNITRQKIA